MGTGDIEIDSKDRRQSNISLKRAVAVASAQAARAVRQETDAMVCLKVPAEFYAVGQFFREFEQVSDEDVIKILASRETQVSAAG